MSGKMLMRIILIAVLAISVFGIIAMRSSIDDTDRRLDELRSEIRQQTITNNEISAILDEENADDFYKDIAEKDLDFGSGSEKVYIDITGQ